MGYKHTSLGRPSHSTLAKRALFERQLQQAQALGALIAVHRQIAKYLEEDRRSSGWVQHGNEEEWSLYENDLLATVFRSPGRDKFTAQVCLPGGYVDVAKIALQHEALQWCEELLHRIAVEALASTHRQIAKRIALNARADELRATGADDESEGSMWDEHLEYGY